MKYEKSVNESYSFDNSDLKDILCEKLGLKAKEWSFTAYPSLHSEDQEFILSKYSKV